MAGLNSCQFDLENSFVERSFKSIWHRQSTWLNWENVMEEFASSWDMSPGCMVWSCVRLIGLIDNSILSCVVEACDYKMKVN